LSVGFVLSGRSTREDGVTPALPTWPPGP